MLDGRSNIGLDYDKKEEKTGPCQNHDKETGLMEANNRLAAIKKNFTEAKKFDEGKPGYSNIPRLALLEVAKVMTYGANNYGKYNYSGKIESSRLTDALERHLNKYMMNEDIDELSYHHIAHVAANALMLLDNILTKNIVDNRNKIYVK